MMRHLDKTRAPLRPFRIEIPQGQLSDLRARIAHTRWPDDAAGARVKALAEYWRDAYDWRKHEETLNEFPQFATTIDGANLHFLHLRSAEPRALPLLLVHGWPSSVVEFVPVIEPLTRSRSDAFHVVVPSLPGFGFSGPTREGVWDVPRITRALAQLMSRLGYERFVAHGSDLGARIVRELEVTFPERVARVHVPAARPEAPAVRPEGLAYSLHDSPVGQLAWILDFLAASDRGVDRDALLTNVMLYWLTGTAGSSARVFLESIDDPDAQIAAPPSPEQLIGELRAFFRACR